MNSQNYDRGSPDSNNSWMRGLRTAVARLVLWLGRKTAIGAEKTALFIAPWIDEDPL